VTKAELKRQFLKRQGEYMDDSYHTNEYALHLQELLEEYLGLPAAGIADER
jgi:hypothetical protein